MPFLVVNGTTIKVAAGVPVQRKRIERGERQRAFDLTLLSSVDSTRKDQWQITTPPVPRADADSYKTAIEGTPPYNCSGDLLAGTVSCHGFISSWESIPAATGEYVIITFELWQA